MSWEREQLAQRRHAPALPMLSHGCLLLPSILVTQLSLPAIFLHPK